MLEEAILEKGKARLYVAEERLKHQKLFYDNIGSYCENVKLLQTNFFWNIFQQFRTGDQAKAKRDGLRELNDFVTWLVRLDARIIKAASCLAEKQRSDVLQKKLFADTYRPFVRLVLKKLIGNVVSFSKSCAWMSWLLVGVPMLKCW